ncbi:MAG: hypothetical protein RLZZ97_1797 [Gemmatimonadota bacterium]
MVDRALSYPKRLALSGAMLLLSSCRLANPTTALDPNRGNPVSLEAMVSGRSVQNGAASPLAVLRYANRLPRIDFPTARTKCLTEGDDFGSWTVRFDGYGCVAVGGEGRWSSLEMGPKAAQKEYMTHAPMVLGPQYGSRLAMHTRLETTAQLRSGTPNPWEVGWVIWQYTDDEHFYYFIPKPNGWELGKRDPSYPGGQRFLGSGSEQTFPIGQSYDVTIVQVNDEIAAFVDGREVVRFRDQKSPYRKGRIGIYAEDATVKVHSVRAL